MTCYNKKAKRYHANAVQLKKWKNYFPKQCIFKYSAKQMQKKMLLHTNADKGSANRPLTGQSFSENKVLPFQDIVFLAGNSTRDSKVNMI